MEQLGWSKNWGYVVLRGLYAVLDVRSYSGRLFGGVCVFLCLCNRIGVCLFLFISCWRVFFGGSCGPEIVTRAILFGGTVSSART